mmetsp:Transcript_55225/g.66478  ORF Transcript_55225/g.66478 Transcript_55225/m.66478 type:complete len:132 (+) Transcript_55225:19-414(+)
MKLSIYSLVAWLVESGRAKGEKLKLIDCSREDIPICIQTDGCRPFKTSVGGNKTWTCILKEGSEFVSKKMKSEMQSNDPSGKPSNAASGKPSDTPSGKLLGTPSEKLSDSPSGKLSVTPSENLSDPPSGKL